MSNDTIIQDEQSVDRRYFLKITSSTILLSLIAADSYSIINKKRNFAWYFEGERMRTPIRLSANKRFAITLHARYAEPRNLGWFYLDGHSGNARIQIHDGATNPLGEQSISSPAIIASCLFADKLQPIRIELIAGDDGFQGDTCFELLG